MKVIHFISATKLAAGIITILLVLGKFIGIVHWDWVWVFSPFWVAAGFECTVLALALAASVILKIIKWYLEKAHPELKDMHNEKSENV